jgi:hypothetical protein
MCPLKLCASNADSATGRVDGKGRAGSRLAVLRAVRPHDQLWTLRESLEPSAEARGSQTALPPFFEAHLGELPDPSRRGHRIGIEASRSCKSRGDTWDLYTLLAEEQAACRHGFGPAKGNYRATGSESPVIFDGNLSVSD